MRLNAAITSVRYALVDSSEHICKGVPANMPVPVLVGQKTIAGETVIADMSGVIPEPSQMRER